MKTLLYSLLLSVALVAAAGAQNGPAGTWQGNLDVGGKALAIRFVITSKPGGGFTAIVTSPDEGGIKDEPAKSVEFADGKLKIDVPSLSGGYAGTLKNGVIEGEWSQEGSKLPLTLRPFEKPTLTKADIDTLRGEWIGTLKTPGGSLTMVFRFKSAPNGALVSTFDVPEQGVKDWETSEIALDDGQFSLEIPKIRGKFTGMLKGEEIAGQWSQLGNVLPLTVKKGKYVEALHFLDLPVAARKQLEGRWSGTLNNLPVVVRFETDVTGRTRGTFESTKQGLSVPITEVTLTGTKLKWNVSYGATYTAEVTGDKMTGQWEQKMPPQPLPLVLTREK